MKAGGSPRASGWATISAGLQAMEHPAMPAGPVHHRGNAQARIQHIVLVRFSTRIRRLSDGSPPGTLNKITKTTPCTVAKRLKEFMIFLGKDSRTLLSLPAHSWRLTGVGLL